MNHDRLATAMGDTVRLKVSGFVRLCMCVTLDLMASEFHKTIHLVASRQTPPDGYALKFYATRFGVLSVVEAEQKTVA